MSSRSTAPSCSASPPAPTSWRSSARRSTSATAWGWRSSLPGSRTRRPGTCLPSWAATRPRATWSPARCRTGSWSGGWSRAGVPTGAPSRLADGFVKLSLQAARRLAVSAQGLAGLRPPATAEGLLQVARALRCVQIDAVSVVGAPTQLLVPFSRVGPYDQRLLDRLLYQDRVLFHYFAHAASLVLTEDFALHQSSMRPYAARTDGWGRRIASWMADNADLRQQVIQQITHSGPLRSRDCANNGRTDWRSGGA